MKSGNISNLKYLFGWPLSLIAFFFIGKTLFAQLSTLNSHINHLNYLLLLFGLVCFTVFYFLRSYLWYQIICQYTKKITFQQSCYWWSISELKRYIPGNVWSFLGRTLLFSKHDIDKKDIAKSLLYEAQLFVLGCLTISLLSLPFFLATYNIFLEIIFILVVIVLITVFIFHKTFITRLPKIFHYFFSLFPPTVSFSHLILSVIALFFFGLGNYFVINAVLSINPQLIWQLVGVSVFAFLVGYLSFFTPAGLGVREGILIFALTKHVSSGVAAFTALFSRLILIIAEVIFIGISYFLYRSKNYFIKKILDWIGNHKHVVLVWTLILIYILYFSIISILRYNEFYAGRFDLGNMAQTVWNTSKGNYFMLTDPNGTREVSRLAFHADFILILLTPFYWIWTDPRMLLLIQTIVVGIGGYFVYLLTKRILSHKTLAVIFTFAYLINPSVQRVTIYDFHAPALATTFLLATTYFYLKRKYLLFLLFALLAAFCKEQIWVIIAIFGLFLTIHHRKWVFGIILTILTAGIFYFLVAHAIPQALGDKHFALDYYADFGDSPEKIIKTVILSPHKIVLILLEKEHLRYLMQIFQPLGYLSLFAPWFLIFAAPDLLINLLSNNKQLYQIYYQYTAAITPFVFIAALYGIWILRWIVKIKIPSANRSLLLVVLILYILYQSLSTAYLYGPLPGSQDPNITMITKPERDKDLINQTLSAIPDTVAVAASNNIGAHLSNRRNIYVLPQGVDKADILVFLLTETEHGPSFAAETKLLKKLKQDPQYKIVVQKDQFTVLEKKK